MILAGREAEKKGDNFAAHEYNSQVHSLSASLPAKIILFSSLSHLFGQS